MCLRIKFSITICLIVIPQFVFGQQNVPTPDASAANPLRSIPSFPLPTAATTKILRALNEPTTVDWKKTPFEAALDSLENENLEIWIDKHALQSARIPTNVPIQLQLKEVPLRSCLRLLLEPLGLVYVIDNDKMLITSAEASKTRMVTRVYPIGDLSLIAGETEQLKDALKCGLGMPTEFKGIAPFVVSGRTKTLTVRESPGVQEKVEELLQAIRDAQVAAVQVPGSRTVPSSPQPTPIEDRINHALVEQTSPNWTDTKLLDAMRDLQKQHKVNIWFDSHALSEAGVEIDQLITLQLQNISLESCLQLLLEPLGLVYSVERDVLVVTSQAAQDAKIVTRVYPIADLCATPDDAPQLLQTFECGLGQPRSLDGGPRMVVSPRLKSLIVRDSTVAQQKIQELILALRDARAVNPKAPERSLPPY